MPLAEPRRAKEKPVNLLDVLVVVVLISAIVGSTVLDMWMNPVGRRWMIGMMIAVPVLLTLRKRTAGDR